MPRLKTNEVFQYITLAMGDEGIWIAKPGSDAEGKMNLNVQQAGGSVLVVSQFTLAADTERGMRPSFSKGASPDRAEALYDYFVERCRQQEMNTQTGRFAADMQVSLVNDGPVTFWLQV